jgi:hypothetical protein
MEIGALNDSVGNKCWSEIVMRESIWRLYKEKILGSYNVNNNVTVVLKRKQDNSETPLWIYLKNKGMVHILWQNKNNDLSYKRLVEISIRKKNMI